MPALQYFLLDSAATGYAAALTALLTETNANLSYTPTQVLRLASHDSTLKIICAIVDESDLTGDLADLHEDSYPTALCRHRWTTRTGFRTSGFHMLGESVRSHEGVSGRTARFIRPQNGATSGNPGVPQGADYGDGSGATDYDAFNGPLDPDIADGGATDSAMRQTGTSYFYKGGAFVRNGALGNGGNIDYPGENGQASQGKIAVADATGLGDAGKINFYMGGDSSPLGPGMFWGGYTYWERLSTVPWELYDTGIYVNGGFQGEGADRSIGQTSVLKDADIDDITVDADTLTKRHHFKGQASLASLSGATGRGRYYAQRSFWAAETFDAVKTFDGSNFTDVTTEANDATTGDWTPLALGAADGSAVYFIDSEQFSTIDWSGTVGATGAYTGVWEYSKGSDTWGQFTNIDDNTNAFQIGGAVQFNPKKDWATDTVDGSTGYIVRWRKAGGTVTQAATGTQAEKQRNAVFIHRWDDSAPTRGMCHGSPGYRHDLNGKANYEYVNARIGTGAMWDEMKGCSGVVFSGCQLLPYGDLQLGSSDMTPTFRASRTDKGQAVWWGIDDIRVPDKTVAPIPDVLEYVITLGGDTTKFDAMREWSDIVYCVNGLFPGVGGGRWNPITVQGLRIRKVGVFVDLMNDTKAIDLWLNDNAVGSPDHHSFAMRGDQDADAFTLEQLGFEDFLRAVEMYAPATGGNDAPVSGSASACKNWRFKYGYHHTHNGMTDSGQPAAGFVFSGDNDRGKYDDGSGGDGGNEVWYWGFKDINNETDAAGSAISNSAEEPVKVRGCVFDGCRWAVSLGRSAGPDSCNAITETTGPAYGDITTSVMDSGNTATALFASGAAGNILNLGVAVRVLRRFGFTITAAGVGAPVLAWEYRRASDWAAVANLSDGTSGLTATGTVTFDRPTDAATLDIDGKTCFWVRCRIASGAFSTVPEADRISSRTIGASIDIDTYTVKNIVKGVMRNVTNDFTNNSAVIRDDHATIELAAGQASTDSFYKIGSTDIDSPDLTFAEWQALAKSKTNTDASDDSAFGPNSTMREAS